MDLLAFACFDRLDFAAIEDSVALEPAAVCSGNGGSGISGVAAGGLDIDVGTAGVVNV